MSRKKISVVFSALLIASMVLTACSAPTPQVVKKVVTEVVKEEVKVVETSVVEKVVEPPVVSSPVPLAGIAWLPVSPIGASSGVDPFGNIPAPKTCAVGKAEFYPLKDLRWEDGKSGEDYASKATYKNKEGYLFFLEISSAEQTPVNQYRDTAQICLEVLEGATPIQPPVETEEVSIQIDLAQILVDTNRDVQVATNVATKLVTEAFDKGSFDGKMLSEAFEPGSLSPEDAQKALEGAVKGDPAALSKLLSLLLKALLKVLAEDNKPPLTVTMELLDKYPVLLRMANTGLYTMLSIRISRYRTRRSAKRGLGPGFVRSMAVCVIKFGASIRPLRA